MNCARIMVLGGSEFLAALQAEKRACPPGADRRTSGQLLRELRAPLGAVGSSAYIKDAADYKRTQAALELGPVGRAAHFLLGVDPDQVYDDETVRGIAERYFHCEPCRKGVTIPKSSLQLKSGSSGSSTNTGSFAAGSGARGVQGGPFRVQNGTFSGASSAAPLSRSTSVESSASAAGEGDASKVFGSSTYPRAPDENEEVSTKDESDKFVMPDKATNKNSALQAEIERIIKNQLCQDLFRKGSDPKAGDLTRWQEYAYRQIKTKANVILGAIRTKRYQTAFKTALYCRVYYLYKVLRSEDLTSTTANFYLRAIASLDINLYLALVQVLKDEKKERLEERPEPEQPSLLNRLLSPSSWAPPADQPVDLDGIDEGGRRTHVRSSFYV
jgi:hypothetical protein